MAYLAGLALLLVFLPAVIAGSWWNWEKETGLPPPAGETAAREEFNPAGNATLQIYVADRGRVEEMELETYVCGVVAAEMPASFQPEALKAQAVAARTYALQKAGPGGGCPNHPGAALCTESSCCQAWIDEQGAREKWPAEEASAYLQRIQTAVAATRGQVLTAAGELVTAVYHSTCGGKTEAGAELWGGETGAYPYLQSVDCPYCQNSPYHHLELEMDLAAYAAALRDEKEALPVLAENNLPLLQIVRKSASGRNLQLRMGQPGRLYSGSDVRRLLGLPSTNFSWRVKGEKIIFSTKGHGHGVGMCQYGADGLAREGVDYVGILQYYYQGVEIEIPALLDADMEPGRANNSYRSTNPGFTSPGNTDG